MESIISVILDSGRSAIDMALYILLPVMVVMMSLMKLLDAKGVLSALARWLTPLLKWFGVPGLGIFAMVKLLFVSFAAPVATFSLLDSNGTPKRMIAATFAMILTMSQANVVFPMAAMGLDVPFMMISSLVGGLLAASVTYYLLYRQSVNAEEPISALVDDLPKVEKSKKSSVQILADGGQEGLNIVLSMLPMLILAICFVNALKVTGGIELISAVLAPVLTLVGLPDVAVLPIVTKFIAGGTAFMGVTVDLMNQGLISATDLNRMAGFATNPLDIVGVAVLAAAGSRVKSVARVAVWGAVIGVTARGVLHLLWY